LLHLLIACRQLYSSRSVSETGPCDYIFLLTADVVDAAAAAAARVKEAEHGDHSAYSTDQILADRWFAGYRPYAFYLPGGHL